jgi:phosphatidylserine/phosphatidylglycerophosphate/cardiolipin synthase-like enzyme
MRFFLRASLFGVAAAMLFFAGYEAGSFGGVSTAKVIYSLDAKQNDQEIIRLIDEADRYAYFAVYTFTKPDIAEALVRAKRRGVDVEGITDRDQAALPEEASVLATLRAGGIPVGTQKHPDGIMHIKALVTDQAYAVGSYNWTWAATNVNDEILEIGTDENVREEYLDIVRRVIKGNR